ncbi:hypothetical protein KIPB_008350 [Kipferlia bialata]|uniref:Uncharacterized protein n=1 Tax=Kipferlia bialata TaxID=797122 RepID=A0A391NXI0_9EUKA|nr:hypothetical protein KIPB_008350 [Kipferlia bialata]|eukprot:g8350.t1
MGTHGGRSARLPVPKASAGAEEVILHQGNIYGSVVPEDVQLAVKCGVQLLSASSNMFPPPPGTGTYVSGIAVFTKVRGVNMRPCVV